MVQQMFVSVARNKTINESRNRLRLREKCLQQQAKHQHTIRKQFCFSRLSSPSLGSSPIYTYFSLDRSLCTNRIPSKLYLKYFCHLMICAKNNTHTHNLCLFHTRKLCVSEIIQIFSFFHIIFFLFKYICRVFVCVCMECSLFTLFFVFAQSWVVFCPPNNLEQTCRIYLYKYHILHI